MFAITWDGAAFSTVIVRESGRSSIPETSVVETMRRGVLDAPACAWHDGGPCGALCESIGTVSVRISP